MTLANSGELGLGTTAPASWLHVLSRTGGTVAASEVFRTAVPASTETNWRMLKGSNTVMRLWVPGNSDALFMQSPRGDFKLSSGHNGTTIAALQIKGGNGTDAGNVSVGNFSVLSSPQALLHLFEDVSVDFQMTNTTTGNTATDGFRILNDATGAVSVNNWENADISFGTANPAATGGSLTPRMVIRGGSNYGRVGVGTNSPGAALHVEDQNDIDGTGDDIGIICNTGVSTTNTGLRSMGARVNAANGYGTIGIETVVDNTSANTNIDMRAIYTRCRNTNTSNVSDAYNFYAQNDGSCTSVRKYGYFAIMEGSGSANSYGGYFNSNCSAGNNFGIWAKAPDQTCSGGTPGTPGTCAGAAGFFDGEVWASGEVYSFSDLNFKNNISPIQNASALLAALEPKQYTFNHQVHPQVSLPYGNKFGFIAQEVAAVIPDLVKDFNYPAQFDSLGNETAPAFNAYGLNYMGIIPILVAAVKEQQQTIDSLLSALQTNTPFPAISPQNKQKISLSDAKGIILNQNDPNPFTENTRISYVIPEEVNDAKIIFTNASGVIINTVLIQERGAGELEVYASDLSKGLFNYTLVCDGKIIASKKMMKQ